MKAYHREAYLDLSVSLIQNQASKSRLKLFHRNWSDFLRINVLGTFNNGNPTLESAKVLHAMLSLSNVPFGYLIFHSIMSKINRPEKEQCVSIVHPCLITVIYESVGVPFRSNDV